MRQRSIFISALVFGMLLPIALLSASGQQDDTMKGKVARIMAAYVPGGLSKADAEAIHEAFRENELHGGPELDDAVLSAGFDPITLRELSPSPKKPGDDRKDDDSKNGDRKPKGEGEGDKEPGQVEYSVSQAVSDNAQLHTIAFNALAFLTGNASADTFFPPGKVTDFFGFQYFRDVDSGGMGHNTTFVPRAANNVLVALNDEQIDELIELALEQEEQLTAYGFGRYPLMIAFRKNLEQDFPAGTITLDEEAVIEYSAELYGIDGKLSYRRGEVLGGIISSLDSEQRARLDEMASGGSDTWGFPDDQVDKNTMSHAAHVLVELNRCSSGGKVPLPNIL